MCTGVCGVDGNCGADWVFSGGGFWFADGPGAAGGLGAMFLNRSLRLDMLGGMLRGMWFWSVSRCGQKLRVGSFS